MDINKLLKSGFSKPLLFAVCLLPFAWLVWGVFNNQLGANPVEKVTHETGLWTLRFLLITLTITPLVKLTKKAGFARFRRMLGLFTFFYGVCHFLIWYIADHSLDLGTMWADVIDRPYITFGFLALVVMIPLAITSNRYMISRLGKRWQLLHRATYGVLALGVLHFLWLVKADYLEAGIYAALALVLMAYRAYYWLPKSSSKPSQQRQSAV